MNVFLIRHGETDWNKEKRLQGQTDTKLNEYGIELAKKTAAGLKDIEFKYAFSSPLNRAYTTASIVLEGRGVDIKADERLKEIAFGEYEGMPANERPEKFSYFFDAPEKYEALEGGESYEELCARTGEFINEVLRPLSIREPDINVLVSGHGAMNKSLMLHFLHKEIKDIWSGPFQKNCSVSHIIMNDDRYELVYENKIFY